MNDITKLKLIAALLTYNDYEEGPLPDETEKLATKLLNMVEPGKFKQIVINPV